MNSITLTFHDDGTARTLSTELLDLDQLGTRTIRRASHIWPVHPVKRAIFHALRRLFGDKGRAAAWTRTWSGPWGVVILGRPLRNSFHYVSQSRANCIAWEHEQLS